MARLNIEDDLWVNIGGVIAALGDEDRAVGMVVRFLRTAQSRYQNGEEISEEEFAAKGFHESLIGRFAKRTPSGVQALGSETHFAWLDQKKIAGSAGGKVSARRARSKNGQLLPKEVQAEAKQEPSETKRSQASYSSSSSFSKEEEIQAARAEVIFGFWNEHCEPFAKATAFTPKRRTYAKAQGFKYPDIVHWLDVLTRWKKSDFCLTTWKPTFDDFLNENKRTATLEGKYDNRERASPTVPPETTAIKVLEGIKRYGPDDGEDLRKYLGEQLFRIACKIPGGISSIRQMPNNDFTLKKLAGLLAESASKLEAS